MIDRLSKLERSQYQRHLTLADIGEAGQLRLKHARVLCVGAGGLGSPALQYLAAAGVGTLAIIDGDSVEVTNLQRQILYTHVDIGRLKVDVARERLLASNPLIEVEVYPYPLDQHNACELIARYDVIIDASDNFYTRYLVNDACVNEQKPCVFASLSRFTGQCSVLAVTPGPCYRCIYPQPQAALNCAQAGVLGVLPGIMGSIQALEVIKLIVSLGEPLIGRLLLFDALKMQSRELQVTADVACCACGKRQAFVELPRYEEIMPKSFSDTVETISVQALQQLRQQQADFILLDVREPHEYDICHIDGRLIPLGELPQHVDDLPKDQMIVVHCKSGGRSQRACEFLMAAGFSQVSNLTGGILAWIDSIDPQLTRY